MDEKSREERFAVLFDIRTIIGVLFAVYGIVCLIWGIVDFSAADSAKSGGVNINLWSGIGLLVVAAVFIVWSVTKPFHPPAEAAETTEDDAQQRAAERAGLSR
jgi:cytochrome b561